MAEAAIFIPFSALKNMGIGGHLRSCEQNLQARLVRAHTGVTELRSTGWRRFVWKYWVLDYINHGQQMQRVDGQEFMRLSGVAALYRPGTWYSEWQQAGGTFDDSYILFRLTGNTEKMYRSLTARGGWCHFQDPEQLLADRLRSIAKALFHRRPGFSWFAQGAFLELLGLLAGANPLSLHLRVVQAVMNTRDGKALPARVERYIRDHITEPVRVTDLARHVSLSPSAFAHLYPALAGETPHRTVTRLRIEAAKRILVQEGLKLKEVACRLGFSSEFQLSRAFKQFEGVSPTQYLRLLREKA